MSLAEFKTHHLPASGICPECNNFRGFDLKQWTLIPGHMYCKYCFMKNVSDADEQRRIKKKFESELKTDVEVEFKSDSQLLKEVHAMMCNRQHHDLLLPQFPWVKEPRVESARAHIHARMKITEAVATPGRYLIGPELIDKWGPRLNTLINDAPMSLVKDLGAVICPPGIMKLHRKLSEAGTVLKSMNMWTDDPEEYPLYSAAYVQALAKEI